LEECSRLQRELNLSAVKSATVAGISASTLRDWTSQLPELRERANKESSKKSFDDGPAGQLDSIKDVLLMWMFGRRQQGVVVDVIHVVFKATSLLRTSFGLKSFEAPCGYGGHIGDRREGGSGCVFFVHALLLFYVEKCLKDAPTITPRCTPSKPGIARKLLSRGRSL
jgi:hypothetical protein